MTTGGWVMMVISLAVVWTGVILCYRKILRTPQEEKVPVGFGP